MAEFTGANLVVNWVTTAGTTSLSGDYRSLSWKPSISTVKSTAGSDADEVYLMTQKDKTIDYVGVMQTAGTAMEDALVEGTYGTLIFGPEGTATGKRKYTVPAYSLGPSFDWKYNDVVEISCSFQGSGAATRGAY